jgi:hypothetical protein
MIPDERAAPSPLPARDLARRVFKIGLSGKALRNASKIIATSPQAR